MPRPVPSVVPGATRRLVLVALATGILAACASPGPPAVFSADQIAAERRRAQYAAAEMQLDQEVRLARVAETLLRAGAPVCGGMVRPRLGLLVLHEEAFHPAGRAAAFELGYRDTLRVAYVAPGLPADRAGVRAGDRIVGIDDTPVGPGLTALEDYRGILQRLHMGGATSTVRLRYLRDKNPVQVQVPLEPACAVELLLVPSSEIGTFTDGSTVYLSTALLRYVADDDALAAVVAHEVAHVVLGHVAAKRRDLSVGGLLGSIAGATNGARDEAEPARPVIAPGSMTYAPDAEAEADHLSLYILALADQPFSAAPGFWRLLGQENPKVIALTATHPASAERLLLLDRTVLEIQQKRLLGEELRPTARASGGTASAP